MIVGKLKAKDTDGGSSLSVIVIVDASVMVLVALVTDVLGVIIIVSSSSSSKSLKDEKVTVPVVSPDSIFISGFTFSFWIRLFSLSAT